MAAPTVTTQAVTSIAQKQVTGHGTVTSNGGATITFTGMQYGTVSGALGSSTGTGGAVSGAFTQGISGLSPNTLYYARAYATNSVGTSYGSEVSFTTLDYPKVTGISSMTGISTITF